MSTQRLDTIRRAFLPMEIPFRWTPEAERMRGARLSRQVGRREVAYLYGVDPQTVTNWRREARQKAEAR